MRPLIKVHIAGLIKSDKKIIVELRCGTRKKKGRIGIDRIDSPDVDIVSDLEEGLPFFPENSVHEIHCRNVLEHIENFENLMREIVRVLKENGRSYVFVPHFSNPYYYSDYTHKRFFGLYTFYYFVDREHQLKRTVPIHYTDIRINIISQRLIFKSPFWLSRQTGKLCGLVFNCHRSLQEFYEKHLCYILPCRGIEIVFSPAS